MILYIHKYIAITFVVNRGVDGVDGVDGYYQIFLLPAQRKVNVTQFNPPPHILKGGLGQVGTIELSAKLAIIITPLTPLTYPTQI